MAWMGVSTSVVTWCGEAWSPTPVGKTLDDDGGGGSGNGGSGGDDDDDGGDDGQQFH